MTLDPSTTIAGDPTTSTPVDSTAPGAPTAPRSWSRAEHRPHQPQRRVSGSKAAPRSGIESRRHRGARPSRCVGRCTCRGSCRRAGLGSRPRSRSCCPSPRSCSCSGSGSCSSPGSCSCSCSCSCSGPRPGAAARNDSAVVMMTAVARQPMARSSRWRVPAVDGNPGTGVSWPRHWRRSREFAGLVVRDAFVGNGRVGVCSRCRCAGDSSSRPRRWPRRRAPRGCSICIGISAAPRCCSPRCTSQAWRRTITSRSGGPRCSFRWRPHGNRERLRSGSSASTCCSRSRARRWR